MAVNVVEDAQFRMMNTAVVRPLVIRHMCIELPLAKLAKDHVLFVPPVSEAVTFRDPCSICAYP